MSRVTEFRQLVILSRRFHRRPAHSAYDQAQELLLQQMWETACDYGQRAADNDDEQEQEQIRVRRRKRVRRRMLMMLLASTTSPQVVFRSSPRYWVKFSDPAWTAWWDAVYYKEHSEFDNDCWHQNFRMIKGSFEQLLEECRHIPRMQARDTKLRKAIPLEKRLAVALWRCANGVCTVRQIRWVPGCCSKLT